MFLLRKTKLKTAVLLLGVMFTAASCNLGGAGGGEPVELVWWKPFDDPRIVQPLIEEFQAAHPNIRVNYVQKSIETYETELLDALAASRGPDIFSIHNDWLPRHKDKLVQAPASAGLSLREFREQFVAVAADDLISEGLIYALPLSVDALALYYNRDILSSAGVARPPRTWEELVNLAPRITRTDAFGNFTRSAVALGTAANVNRAPDILQLLMLQNGAGEELDSEQGERALMFYTQFANPAKVTYTWNQRSNNSIEAFSAGSVAMIFSYSYLRDELQGRAPFLNYAVAAVPQISAEGNKVNFANYWAEGVAKQSRHQEAAWQFLKFITQKEVLRKYYEVQKAPSSRVDLLEEQQSDPDIGVFAENALSAKSFPKEDAAAVDSIFVQMIEDVTLRNIAAREAAQAAAEKMDLLKRNY